MTLVVEQAFGLVTVQDFGRVGHMLAGLPHGGALVRELLVRANRLARNADDAPAIEVMGRLVVRATSAIDVASDREARTLAPGETWVVTSEPWRVGYLALRGGVAAPRVLDGHGAHLSAGLGAPLRAGVRISAASYAEAVAPAIELAGGGPIRVIPGPDRDAFDADALPRLLASEYRISPASDRVGTRLDGPRLGRTSAPEVSRPMVRGAIEVPRDGQPIVLGPEHPTTGGYPVIAVVAAADLSRFFAIRLGGTVRFGS